MVNVSIVIPAKNEEGNISSLVNEIRAAMNGFCEYEIVYINDGSTDGTLQKLKEIQADFPGLRIWSHDKSTGQSQAVVDGVKMARYPVIATLDADGQNDPADIPAMVELLERSDPQTALIAGYRTKRKDSWLKRFSSKYANAIRSRILNDGTPDTGCGLKVFQREKFLELPYFDHMHRYIPALLRREGYDIVVHEVNHRHRHAGTSKYGFHNRFWTGIVDILGVIWLQRRHKKAGIIDENQDNV